MGSKQLTRCRQIKLLPEEAAWCAGLTGSCSEAAGEGSGCGGSTAAPFVTEIEKGKSDDIFPRCEVERARLKWEMHSVGVGVWERLEVGAKGARAATGMCSLSWSSFSRLTAPRK